MSLFEEYRPRPAGEAIPGPPADVVIRPGLPDDLAAMIEIARERHPEEAEGHRERFLRDLAEAEGAADRRLLVALRSGIVAAYARVRHFRPAPDAPPDSAPVGWYLSGVVVARAQRRLGIGAALTRSRLEWVAGRAREAWYFANAQNLASIDLHARFGFREVTREFSFPGATFVGGVGILFRAAW